MSARFRPTVEQLDTRDLPSTYVGFLLPSGDVASGSFNLATAQINPNLSSQSIAITDLDFEVDEWTIPIASYTTSPAANFVNGQYAGISFAATVSGNAGVQSISVQNAGAVTALNGGQSVQAIVATVGLPTGVSSVPPVNPPARVDPPITMDPQYIQQLASDYQTLLLRLDVLMATQIQPRVEEIDDLTEQNQEIIGLLRTAVGAERAALIALLSANDTRIAKLKVELTFLQIEYNSLATEAYWLYHTFLSPFMDPEDFDDLDPPPDVLNMPPLYVLPPTQID